MIGIGPKARYTDETLNRYTKTNLLYTTDKYMLYQDPTHLGFKFLFEFDQPTSGLLSRYDDVNTAMGYLSRLGDEYRMNYLNKFVTQLENINRKCPWFFQTIEGLDQAWKRGYNEADFKAALPKDRKITIGCEESIDLRMTTLMDFYRKACFDWNMRREVVPWNLRTFTVYVYIYEARTINVTGRPSPSGMLDFSKLLGLSDVNKKQQEENKKLLGKTDDDQKEGALSQARSAIQNSVNSIKQDPINGIKNALNPKAVEGIDSIDTRISHVMFKFSKCEWLPDESSEIFTKVSNIIADRASQKIAFSYRDVSEVNLNNIYSSDLRVRDAIIGQLKLASLDVPYIDDPKKGPGGWSLESVLNNAGVGVLAPFATMAADAVEKLVASYAGKLLMGNIYGFSLGNALSSAGSVLSGDPTAMVQGASQLIGQLTPSKSLRNKTHKIQDPGQAYYDRITPNDTTDTAGRIGNAQESSPSLSNRSIDSVDRVGSNEQNSISLSNNTNDVDQLGNTFD
jgi:hypothetical protein